MDLSRLPAVSTLIDLALEEDLGRGDVTTRAVLAGGDTALAAAVVARESLVVAGIDVAVEVFRRVDPELDCQAHAHDGDRLDRGDQAVVVRGRASSILSAERTVLNFLMRLSGIATTARRYADAVDGTGARVVDTRKTTPGYRVLEKAAVRAGGCHNHRADLGSEILIKDNHIAACGSVRAAVERARRDAPHSLTIEVELDRAEDLDVAIEAGAQVVLLDNMSVADVERAARRAHEAGVRVEVSGGIDLGSVGDYARAGADVISCGALTHSAVAVDLGLDALLDVDPR